MIKGKRKVQVNIKITAKSRLWTYRRKHLSWSRRVHIYHKLKDNNMSVMYCQPMFRWRKKNILLEVT
jgi:hypothetical protein